MTELFYFIGGVLFTNLFYPFLDSVITYWQNIFQLKSVRLQAEAEKIQLENDSNPVHAIGFTIPDDEMEDDE